MKEKAQKIFLKKRRIFFIFLILSAFLSPNFIKAQCIPIINLGSDVTFCAGNSITIDATDSNCPNASYLWNQGSGTPTIATTPTITITTSGTYHVVVTSGPVSVTDSITITVHQPPALFLGIDQTICTGSSIQLGIAFDPSHSYQWSTGDTTNYITVNQAGSYYLDVTNACGTFSDTITIGTDQSPRVVLPPARYECVNNQFVIRPFSYNGQLTWGDGSTDDSLVVTQTGVYQLTATNACGSTTDSIALIFNESQAVNLPDTVFICPGASTTFAINLSPLARANGSLLWSTGATGPSITVSTPGIYWAEFTDSCESIRDSTEVVLSQTGTPVNLGPDTTFCDNVNLTLDAGSGTTYLWSTGSRNPTITISRPGTFWVRVNNGCAVSSDTINVSTNPAPRPQVPDTARFCTGGSITLRAGPPPNPNRTYLWSTGQTTNRVTFNTPGNYWVRRAEGCSPVSQTFTVVEDSVRRIVLSTDTLDCIPSRRIFIDTGYFATDTIVWSNGMTNVNSIVVKDTGQYFVRVFNDCGVFGDTIFLDFQRPPDNPELLRYYCSGDSVRIGHLNPQEGTRYLWGNGDTTNFRWISQTGTYTFTARNVCDTLTWDIRVEEINQNAFRNILGPDTTACLGDSVFVSIGGFPKDSVTWINLTPLPGDTIAYTRFARTGGNRGQVIVYNKCGAFRDSISVDRYRRTTSNLQDQSFCFGDSALLDASHPNASHYLWSTGDTTPTIYAKNGGWVSVVLSNTCYTFEDSAYMNLNSGLNQIDLGRDTIFCAGTLILDPGLPDSLNYVWQDGSTNPTFVVGLSGTYYVTVSDTCGSVSDTINVLITGTPRLILGNRVTYCSNNTLTLNAQNIGSTYLWNTGDTTQTLAVPAPGLYWVTITNDCGQITDSVNVVIEYPIDNLDLGRDTAICPGDSIRVFTGYSDISTTWQDGSSDTTFLIDTAGTYFVTLTNSCETESDTIRVRFLDPPVFRLGNDTTICSSDDTANIYAPPGPYTYLWSTGSTDSFISVAQPGQYSLTLTDACGLSFTDTLTVFADDSVSVNLGRDTVLCPQESILLNTGITDYTVVWEDGTRNSARLIDGSGTYHATVTNECGVFSDTIRIQMIEDVEIDPSLYQLCEGDTLIIDLRDDELFDGGSIEGYEVFWEDGFPDSLRIITEGGLYDLVLRNRCYDYNKTFTVESARCECPLYIPNAFTPNGDAKNERFAVVSPCDLTSFHMIIFNRWGQQVFESKEFGNFWDGTFNGQEVNNGVYTYRLLYGWSVFEQDFSKEVTGTITLLR